jgi:hypothetical protein
VNNAHRVVLEAIAGLAHKKRLLRGDPATLPGAAPDPAALRYPVAPAGTDRTDHRPHDED